MNAATRSAVAAAVAVAEAQGIRCDDPVVLRDAWHVLVHLRPAPIVARVSTGLEWPGGPTAEDVVRELAVAGHAARAGAPVVPPADDVDPGPHHRDGHAVAFWRYVEHGGDVDPGAAGRRLREVHDALADFDAPLPPAGHPADVVEMLASLPPSRDIDVLREAASQRPEGDGQALHGDAHLFNCMPAAAGPLWHDFETACRGPREYDLAALVHHERVGVADGETRAALAAYGGYDTARLEAWLPIYVAWVTVSMLTALERRPELARAIDVRVRWLRASVGAS